MKVTIVVVAVLVASAFTVIQSGNWKLKEGAYSITFAGKHLEGALKGLKTTILFDASNPEKGKITASLDVNTISTGNGLKNTHAKSETGLDAKQFPLITFESTSISGKDGKYNAVGKLTLKGISKEINLPFTFESRGTEGLFKGQFSIATKDYNITRSGAPDVLDITLNVPVTK